jgi:hypothetical protein
MAEQQNAREGLQEPLSDVYSRYLGYDMAGRHVATGGSPEALNALGDVVYVVPAIMSPEENRKSFCNK